MDELIRWQKDIEKRIALLEKLTTISSLKFPTTGVLVIPVRAADPSTPSEGEIWVNSTSHTIKIYENSTVKTFTTT